MSQTLRSASCLAPAKLGGIGLRKRLVLDWPFVGCIHEGGRVETLQHCPDAQTIGAAEFEGGRAELPTMRNRIPGRKSALRPVRYRTRARLSAL